MENELDQLRELVARLKLELEMERQKRMLAESIARATQGLTEHTLRKR